MDLPGNSTPLESDAVTAIMEIEFVPVELGCTSQLVGLGSGADVSCRISVVADAGDDGPVIFWLLLLSRAITV